MRNFISRLMYGRYGSDALNLFLLMAGLVLYLLGVLIPVRVVAVVLRVAGYAAVIFTVYRMWSKNYTRRREENDWFIEHITHVQSVIRSSCSLLFHPVLIATIVQTETHCIGSDDHADGILGRLRRIFRRPKECRQIGVVIHRHTVDHLRHHLIQLEIAAVVHPCPCFS